jgi:hypothetical protein
MMTVRLLVAFIFHLGNYREVQESYKRLKFIRKFPERFNENLIMSATMIVLYHFIASITVEFANIIFLTR